MWWCAHTHTHTRTRTHTYVEKLIQTTTDFGNGAFRKHERAFRDDLSVAHDYEKITRNTCDFLDGMDLQNAYPQRLV